MNKNILHKLNSFTLVFSCFTLWISGFLSTEAEGILSYALILSIGVVHGANDVSLLLKDKKESSLKEILKIIFIYVVVVLGTAALFFNFIAMATLLFIILSGYHFGEQHWAIRLEIRKKFKYIYHTLYGILIFSLLFHLNETESIAVIQDLTAVILPDNLFFYTSIASGGLVILFCSYFYIYIHRKWQFWLQELFFIAVIALIFKTASLIWAFAIYFIIWHSLPSLLTQLIHIYGKAEKDYLKAYVKSSLLYWIGAIVFLLMLFYFLQDYHKLFISILVAFLAAITLPHAIVMTRMFTHKKR
ncbi:Brp/Blh family beta-carotene 15,15'-dioxygenase [Dokdonia sinensis]|uniref:Brp/Blh family beta-carotene 15,15'-dioxygenase n=1 Tax=Dokdonia sinensis TaxID=2479847 RepID=UPI001375210B|nr:Brp/Blh family beta-carotene 15,15'-dioxygenase [Dokdonia sinensis]